MYCSTCASEIRGGLNYCNSCGAKTIDENSELKKTIAKNFSIGLAVVGAFGLIGFVVLIKAFLENGVNLGAMFAVAVLYMGIFAGLCYVLLTSILKTVGGAELNSDRGESESAVQITAAKTKELDEYKVPAVSVVEDTTKSLNKVPVKR